MPKIMKHPDRNFYVAYIANPLLGKYKNGRVKLTCPEKHYKPESEFSGGRSG